MINGANGNLDLSKLTTQQGASKNASAPTTGQGSFADMLKNGIEEVSRLQQDASQAVENLALGKTEDVTGVMTAMEKSNLAFKTLLSIRNKLMEAYDEVKNISV